MAGSEPTEPAGHIRIWEKQSVIYWSNDLCMAVFFLMEQSGKRILNKETKDGKKGVGRTEGKPGLQPEEQRMVRLTKGIWAMLFALAALAVLRGAIVALPGTITVSRMTGQEVPVYRVETDKKQVALTFDTAGGNADITRILGILEKHGCHATFFLTGGWVENYPEEVKAILAAGG